MGAETRTVLADYFETRFSDPKLRDGADPEPSATVTTKGPVAEKGGIMGEAEEPMEETTARFWYRPLRTKSMQGEFKPFSQVEV